MKWKLEESFGIDRIFFIAPNVISWGPYIMYTSPPAKHLLILMRFVSFERQSCFVDQAGTKFAVVLLLLHPVCLDCGQVAPQPAGCLIFVFLKLYVYNGISLWCVNSVTMNIQINVTKILQINRDLVKMFWFRSHLWGFGIQPSECLPRMHTLLVLSLGGCPEK